MTAALTAPLTITVAACDGSWVTPVTFRGDVETASANALRYLTRKDAQYRRADGLGRITWALEDGDVSDELASFLWPSCEHGMSASLCAGPNHYPSDSAFYAGPVNVQAEGHAEWRMLNAGSTAACPWDCCGGSHDDNPEHYGPDAA